MERNQCFHFLRRELLVTHKGKLFSFRVDGRECVSVFLKENGYLGVNAAIYSRTNNLVCEIGENDIVPNLPRSGDLTCSAQGKKIEIRSQSNDAYLSLKFDRIDESTLFSSIKTKWPKRFHFLSNFPKQRECVGLFGVLWMRTTSVLQ